MSQHGGRYVAGWVDGIPAHGGVRCQLLPQGFIIVHPCVSFLTLGLFDNEACIRKLVPGDRVGR